METAKKPYVYILTQCLNYGRLTEREVFKGVFSSYALAQKAEAAFKAHVCYKDALFTIAQEELNVSRKVW